jgi:hypothetical protein
VRLDVGVAFDQPGVGEHLVEVTLDFDEECLSVLGCEDAPADAAKRFHRA